MFYKNYICIIVIRRRCTIDMKIERRHSIKIRTRTDCFNFLQLLVDLKNTLILLLSVMDEEVEGFRVVAQALAQLGVKYMFGVVGIPVIEVKSFVDK